MTKFASIHSRCHLPLLAFLLASCSHSSDDSAANRSCTDPFSCQDQGLASTGSTCGGSGDSTNGGSQSPTTHVGTVKWENAPADVLHNLEGLNKIRSAAGLSTLVLDKNLSDFALVGSKDFAASGNAHAHIEAAGSDELAKAGFCGGASAENQGYRTGADVNSAIDDTLQSMMDEGAGGGHHDNIVHADWGKVGIGILVVNGRMTLTNDFSKACD